jgi:hypothetical protein
VVLVMRKTVKMVIMAVQAVAVLVVGLHLLVLGVQEHQVKDMLAVQVQDQAIMLVVAVVVLVLLAVVQVAQPMVLVVLA